MKIIKKIIKVGDSLAITIPKWICNLMDLKAGDNIEIKELNKIRGSI